MPLTVATTTNIFTKLANQDMKCDWRSSLLTKLACEDYFIWIDLILVTKKTACRKFESG